MFRGKNWKHHQVVHLRESNNGYPYDFHCFIVKHKNSYLIVDSLGKRLFPDEYQYARWTGSNYLILVNKDKASAYTIQSGEFVRTENTNFIFAGQAINFEPNNYVFDKKGAILLQSNEPIVEINKTYYSGKINERIGYSIINKKGKSTLLLDSQKIDCPLRYQLVEEIDENNLLVVTTKGKCGIINKKGGEVLKPDYAAISRYDSLFQGFWVAGNIDTTFGPANLFQKWGIVDSKDKYVFGPHFLQPAHFNNGKAITKKLDKVGLVDTDGRIIIPFNYDLITPFQYDTVAPFHPTLYIIGLNEKYGLADKSGKILLAPQWDDITNSNAHSFPIYWKNGKYREMYLPEIYDHHTSDFRLVATNKNSVSFEHSTSTHSDDGGHCELKCDNYAIRGDSLTKIPLSDLFKVDVDYNKVLNTLLIKKIEQLEDKQTDCEYESRILHCLEERWVIAPEGLIFVIRAGESCDYKKKVIISYPSLKPIINPKGVLREFVNPK